MADIHQNEDVWYEVWHGPVDNRRHLKTFDESEAIAEAQQLKHSNLKDVEVTKLSVIRETIDVSIPESAPEVEATDTDTSVHATVQTPKIVAKPV